MTELSALWLPSLSGAVFCSSPVHHFTCAAGGTEPVRQLPDEEKARAAIGALNVPPGDYMLPCCKSIKDMGSKISRKCSPGSQVDHHRDAAR